MMASLNSVGLVGMIELGRFSELPIHAHRNGWGYLSRHPLLGWSYVAWQKLWRLAGADHMHVNGLQNKFSEDGRERDRLGAGLPDADVRRQAVHRDAGLLVRPVGAAGARHLRGAEVDRPDRHGRRRHHGSSGRACGRRARRCARPGTRRWPGSRSRSTHATHPELGRALEMAA